MPSQLTGVIVEIDGTGSDVESFVVETQAGRYTLFIAEDVAYGFDLAHLAVHRRTGDPVRCRVETRNGRAYALAIADA